MKNNHPQSQAARAVGELTFTPISRPGDTPGLRPEPVVIHCSEIKFAVGPAVKVPQIRDESR